VLYFLLLFSNYGYSCLLLLLLFVCCCVVVFLLIVLVEGVTLCGGVALGRGTLWIYECKFRRQNGSWCNDVSGSNQFL